MEFYYSAFKLKSPAIIVVLDFLGHYLPLILLGLPHPLSYLKAYALLVAYYVPMRKNIHSIYFGIVSPPWADPCVVGAGVSVTAATFLVQK